MIFDPGGEIAKFMRVHQIYSKAFKSSAIQKLLSPNSKGAHKLADELGIGVSTLYAWRKESAIINTTMENKSLNSTKNWTPEEKLEAVIKTASMSEHELGEYLRNQGLYAADLKQWKKDCMNALKPNIGRPKIDPEVFKLRKKEQELERELRQKDKALAEFSARVILLKKSHLLFGVDEDNS